ncbi:uncharacterized protein N7503_002037 [Penicillium pulvis]|uniref:uncharacterized protein n=1 Tax=Penicillium pulvis TaxID=1562058 RepID=UPI002546988E|nr:uncharacterized protein N7503_002037 [Penicillium pulvis]KAJ5809819.1 hypothetical protein N7503_002037 [Penicillium pulvis]
MSSQKQLIPMSDSQKQLIPKPSIIYDRDEEYGTFLNQDDNDSSNAQRDDAIDQTNIMGGDRTHHAMTQFQRQYSEGSDEDDLLDAE